MSHTVLRTDRERVREHEKRRDGEREKEKGERNKREGTNVMRVSREVRKEKSTGVPGWQPRRAVR